MIENEGLTLYSIKELKEMDWSYYAKIKNSNKYIPVKIKNAWNKYLHEKWVLKKDYSIKYIKIEDIENYLWKKLTINFQ
jgi:hypothetical protein